MTRSKRTPAQKPATRSVSKSCHAAGFTLRYRQFHYPKLIDPSLMLATLQDLATDFSPFHKKNVVHSIKNR
ncbi:MAG: hypothetical protein V7K92_23420 [Nostoc sp.]|uniref:hypothetical protein n=1 Tax=Nostoc sp. TaxID=1180 RepID=UPI002FF1DA23